MDPRVSVALSIINSVKVLCGHFQMNQHQCMRLAEFYKRAGQLFGQLEVYSNYGEHQRLHSLSSLDDTITVLQRGRLLLEKYTEENWFGNMLSAGANQDTFVAIHVDMEACILSILQEAVEQGLTSGTQAPLMQNLMHVSTVAPLFFLDKGDRATVFKVDAEMDKKHMSEKIKLKKFATSKARATSNLTMEQKPAETFRPQSGRNHTYLRFTHNGAKSSKIQ